MGVFLPGCIILQTEKDPDLGLLKFTFKYRDKEYTVLPKDSEGYNRIGEYLKYVAGVCDKPGLNPFMYKIRGKSVKDLFDIRPAGTGDKNKEQHDLSQIKKELEQKNKDLEEKKKRDKSEEQRKRLDKVKNIINPAPPEGEQMSLFASDKGRINRVLLKFSGWKDNNATLFWDEITNEEISKENAKKILEAFDGGADTEFSVSKVTKIDPYTCKKVLDIANRFELLK